MSAIRVTAMLCVTMLVIITGALVYANKQDRYVILPQNNSMFIFDRQTAAVNYCTADQCRLVMPYGSATMPTGMPGMMPGMGMSGGMPTGFQPYAMPGGASDAAGVQQTNMMAPTGMGAQQNNPMMMWAYMQAAASMENQKGGFSSLQMQPSWMNIMAMMQPTTAAPTGKSVEAQSPLVPVAMKTSLKKAAEPEAGEDEAAAPAEGGDDEEATAAPADAGEDDEEA